MPRKQSINSRLSKIKLLLLDVDGVMTDGGIYVSNSGDEFKKFNIQDGYGIVKLQRIGINVGIITGRVSNIVILRAKELNITEVHQNLENKLEAYEQIKVKRNLSDSEIAYIGDDEFDLPVLECAGFSAAPSNAVPGVKKRVHYVCTRSGGNGAVREVIDLIIEKKKLS
jgi:3-deoxy-D-manno-octulosonate 8-phosphate phosphatase (KDO 8-P phosphatase)